MEFRKEEMKLMFDLEISRNQLESERMRSTVNHNVGYSNQDVGSFQMPKLPYFVDGKDNIDSYLARFETYAHSMNWPLERYSLCLSSLLTGKALDVLAKIPQSLVHDYEHLKNTLLAEYQLASGDFMKRFFTSRQSGNESATQLMGRLEHYLGRWISLSGTDESFAGLKELFLKEQFLHACPRDLAIFLREQAPGDLPMMQDSMRQDSHRLILRRLLMRKQMSDLISITQEIHLPRLMYVRMYRFVCLIVLRYLYNVLYIIIYFLVFLCVCTMLPCLNIVKW